MIYIYYNFISYNIPCVTKKKKTSVEIKLCIVFTICSFEDPLAYIT